MIGAAYGILMDRTAAMVTALLLVLATVAVPLTAGSPDVAGTSDATAADADGRTPVPVDNSTARLVIPRDQLDRSDVDDVRPDLGAALSNAGDDVHQRNLRVAVEERFEAANSTNDRLIVIDQTLIDLEERTTALQQRHHDTIQRYANGTIGASELLRRLAALDQTARDMLETVSYLRSRSNKMEGQPLIDKINSLEARLDTLKGPVRQEAARALTGTADSTGGFHVQVNGRNLVLATVDDGRYLREAYLADNRGEQEGEFPELKTHTDALERQEEYYPWVWNTTINSGAVSLGSVHRTTQRHSQGELVAYFDAYSGEVFYEIQDLRVSEMPKTTALNVTDNGLQVVVERTYPGGPMRVGVYDAATGQPVNAEVSVAGVDVGPTDADGAVQAVEPRTEYEIAVQTPRTSTNVTVDPYEE